MTYLQLSRSVNKTKLNGTHESLIEASNYIKMIENRQGLKVACLEVIACEKGYINKDQLIKLAKPLKKNGYGQLRVCVAKSEYLILSVIVFPVQNYRPNDYGLYDMA